MLLPLQQNNLLETASADVEVNVGVANLSLTTYQASISYDVEVAANTAALSLQTFQADVDLDVEVDVATSSLTLTTYQASVTYDVEVSVGTAALSLTTYQADIDTGEVDVQVGTANLSLTTYPATVDGVFGGVKGGRTRKRRLYTVTIDGETFTAPTLQDVVNLVDRAALLAEEQAEKVVKTPEPPPVPKIQVKTASGKPSQSKKVKQAVRRAERTVKQSFDRVAEQIKKRIRVDTEISRLIQKKLEREAFEQDEEDAILALML